jgi:hypothetical protein
MYVCTNVGAGAQFRVVDKCGGTYVCIYEVPMSPIHTSKHA